MQFRSDEYLLLSRRGSVPSPTRAGPHRPDPQPTEPPRPRPSRRSAVRWALRRRIEVARAVRGGLRAAWTAFGPGGQDL